MPVRITILLMSVLAMSPAAVAQSTTVEQPSCRVVEMQALGTATSREVSERNAVLKLISAARYKNEVIAKETIQFSCRQQLLWSCTASVKIVRCSDIAQ